MIEAKAFFQAVCEGDAATVKSCLAASPEFVRATDDGATPLHFAAINNQRKILDLLIAHGADLNALDDEFGSTPAGWANEKGYVELTHYLVAKGTKIDLPRAAAFGLIGLVREMIVAEPASINVSSGWGNALHNASVWGQSEIAELLLAAGADPNLKNCEGRTALAIATRQVESQGQGTAIVIEPRRQEILAGCAKVMEILKLHGAQMH